MILTWRRWAFDPVDTAPMAALRIACGLLVVGWTLSLLPDAHSFLSADGLTTRATGGPPGWWTVPVTSPYGALALLGAAALALTLGWRTRAASVLVAVLLIVLQRRNVYVLNSGDLLLRELALFVALMPAGETWSLDARRRGREQLRAPWGLRLLQVQVSVLYLSSVVAKLGGSSWQDGSAVGRVLQLEDLQRFVMPHLLATSVSFSAFATYGTLLVEAALVLGLWIPRVRWWVMAAGVAIHLGIEGTLLIGWFSLTVICCYLAFVPADVFRRTTRWVGRPDPDVGRQPPASVSASAPA